MKAISRFFSAQAVIMSILWFLLNILSYLMVFVYWMGSKILVTFWPIIMLGSCVTFILNPMLGLWIIFRVFLGVLILKCTEVFLDNIHKWTEKNGTPLWSSVEYDDYYTPPSRGWGWGP